MGRTCPDCDGTGRDVEEIPTDELASHAEAGLLALDCSRCDGTGRIGIRDRLRRAARDGLRGR